MTKKEIAGYRMNTPAVACGRCEYCIRLPRNLKCVEHGFLVAFWGYCTSSFKPRSADSMMQALYGQGEDKSKSDDGEEKKGKA